MSEAFIPLESRGVRYQSTNRPCDDASVNFIKIRDPALWARHEAKLAAEAKAQALKVAPPVNKQ